MFKLKQKDSRDLYFIQQQEAPFHFKIGIATNPEKRLKQLQTGSAAPLKIVHVFKGLAWREKELHHLLERFRQSGEWFASNRYSVGMIPIELYEQLPEQGLIQDNETWVMGIKLKV
jgi:hypothetical protein